MSLRILRLLDATGLESLAPIVRLLRGDDSKEQLRRLGISFGAPLVAFLLFLAGWSVASANIMTKYGNLPAPGDVWQQAGVLVTAHFETENAKDAYYEEQGQKAAELRAAATVLTQRGSAAAAEQLIERATAAESAKYSASPSYIDHI